MNELRVIFALMAGAAAVALLVIAARTASGKPGPLRRRRAAAAALYAALFMVVGGILWMRKDIPVASMSPDPAQDVRSVDRAPASAAPPSAEAAVEPPPPPGETSRVSADKPAPLRVPPAAPRRLEPEDRVELAVERAFDAIEAFFDRYGHPATVRTASRPTEEGRIGGYEVHFPNVVFDESGTRLLGESIPVLRSFAADLQRRTDMSLEILARTDQSSNEINNFFLSQARASAIRNFLVEEGVPAGRMSARGYGTRPLPVGGTIPVAFVVRR